MTKIIPLCALYLPYLVVVPAMMAWIRNNTLLRHSLILRGTAALTTAVLLGAVFAHGYYDVRPFVRLHEAPLPYHKADNGFPLWPALLTATVAFVLMPYWRAGGYVCLAIALIVSWARIACLLNSPIDAVGGLLVAAIAALVARGLIRRGEKKRHLYPQDRGSGSGRSDDMAVRANGAQPISSSELEASNPSATISEFDSRSFLGYSDAFYLRN